MVKKLLLKWKFTVEFFTNIILNVAQFIMDHLETPQEI